MQVVVFLVVVFSVCVYNGVVFEDLEGELVSFLVLVIFGVRLNFFGFFGCLVYGPYDRSKWSNNSKRELVLRNIMAISTNFGLLKKLNI